MRNNIEKKLLKTVIYRLTASGLAQMLSWIFFRKIEVNIAVLAGDLVQMVYYFFFESFWTINKRDIKAMKGRIALTSNSMHVYRDLLRRRGYSEKAIKEIWRWYDLS